MFLVNREGNYVVNLNHVDKFFLMETKDGFGVGITTFAEEDTNAADNLIMTKNLFISTEHDEAYAEFSHILQAITQGEKIYRIGHYEEVQLLF